jgi:hypothetical protein
MRKFISNRLYNTISNLIGVLIRMKSSDLNPTVLQVMIAASTDSALRLLKILDSSSKEYDSLTIIEELKLSRKQFYTVTSHLSSVGILQRTTGFYHLTAFGKLVSTAIRLVEDTAKIYSKLKAINMVGTSEQITKEEIMKLINTLIDNERVRELVKLKYSLYSPHIQSYSS